MIPGEAKSQQEPVGHDVAEGVVCKGGSGDDPWMVKIKTNAYRDRLERAFADRWEDYWE